MARISLAVGALGVAVGLVSTCSADAYDTYGDSWRAFQTPPIGGGSFGVSGAALSDGRLLMVTGNSVFLESSVGSASFDEVAILDAAETGGTTDPSFIRVSPGGTRIAVGAGFGKPVVVFDVADLGTAGSPSALTSGSVADYYDVGHFDASWYDDTSLAMTAGDFGQPAFVSLLDTTSATDAPVNPIIVSNIAGASGGVAFDDAGRLYTGNGFADGSGSDTGWIKSFEPADWGTGVDFEAGGVLIGDVLSGGSLHFDREGNLMVGGGDFGDFDAGYLGVINADALAAALGGGGPIDGSDPLSLKRLDPRGDGFGFFGAAFNDVTGELYVTDGSTWYATVPAPGGMAVVGVGLLCAWRRRRA